MNTGESGEQRGNKSGCITVNILHKLHPYLEAVLAVVLVAEEEERRRLALGAPQVVDPPRGGWCGLHTVEER